MMEAEEPIAADEDRNLWTFVSDVQYLAGSVFTLVQFYFYISYLAGKHVVEWLSWSLSGIWGLFCVTADGLVALFDAIIELEKSILRLVLLTRYGVDALFEAFQVTILDVIAFGHRVFESMIQACIIVLNASSDGLSALVFTTPQHICTTLSLIGDTSIEIVTLVITLVRNFLVQLVYSPINLLLTVCQLGLKITTLPGRILEAIPWSAHIGSAVLILVYVLHCKLSFSRFARLIMKCCLYLLNITRNMPSFARRIVSYRLQPSVLTTSSSGSSSDSGKGMCVVCFENPVNFIAYPCNHLCLCSNCVHVLVEIDHRCPICRLRVDHYARVYVS